MWRSGSGWGTSGWSKTAAVGTAWDPATAGAGIVIAGTTVNGQGVGGAVSVRTNTSHSTGKYYVEGTLTDNSFKMCVGIANAAQPNTGDLGNDAFPSNGAGITANGVWQENANGTPLEVFGGTDPAFAPPSDQIEMAINLTNNRVWVRKNNGAWNPALSGTQDPLEAPPTGTNGIDLTNQNAGALNSGPYYLCMSTWLATVNFRFTSASWLHTAPNFYLPW